MGILLKVLRKGRKIVVIDEPAAVVYSRNIKSYRREGIISSLELILHFSCIRRKDGDSDLRPVLGFACREPNDVRAGPEVRGANNCTSRTAPQVILPCLSLTKSSNSIPAELKSLDSISTCLSHAPESCHWHTKPASSPPLPSELRSSTRPRRPPRTLIVPYLMLPSRVLRRLVCLPILIPLLSLILTPRH